MGPFRWWRKVGGNDDTGPDWPRRRNSARSSLEVRGAVSGDAAGGCIYGQHGRSELAERSSNRSGNSSCSGRLHLRGRYAGPCQTKFIRRTLATWFTSALSPGPGRPGPRVGQWIETRYGQRDLPDASGTKQRPQAQTRQKPPRLAGFAQVLSARHSAGA